MVAAHSQTSPQKKYTPPVLVEYGTLRELTLTRGNTGNADCGGGLGGCGGGTGNNKTGLP